ncbi:PEP/pyruvate-binding domain-containing protein [Cryptosporangium arvum]|uniref:PEP/pyruvate-binding domain-containing protein n=1 Tax=Cryptosporangium arvum TaxID=80871 RepID=UPI0004BC73AA|nr:PEP/pyruvate-binding domain-containing protein [Cryptosporangium arvum]
MRWIRSLPADDDPTVVGAKAHGLSVLHRLGLPVPPGFVLTTELHRVVRDTGHLPHSLSGELDALVPGLTGPDRTVPVRSVPVRSVPVRSVPVRSVPVRSVPVRSVSVRSGAAVSMPGMLATVLDVRGRDALRAAIERVLASWDSPRARTYRRLYDLPDEPGPAVVVQAMVFGDRDERSASGVAFSRDPVTGEPVPSGEVAFRAPGVDVVSGTGRTRPLAELAAGNAAVWDELRAALRLVERHYRDVCQVEFTIESGRLWLLQVRRGGVAAGAAARIAVGLVEDGIITRAEAVRRVDLTGPATARRLGAGVPVLTRGTGASPGLASGRVALTAADAVRRAAHGPVILVRPTTSPADLHGLAAASGVVTFRGGPTSHAAVVARGMGKPAVVGATETTLREGFEITIDGETGIVAPGIHFGVTSSDDPAVGLLRQWSTYGLAED